MSHVMPRDFSKKDIGRLSGMTAAEIDALPYGAIKVDRAGTILSYNEAESRLMGLRAPDVIGRNFFNDIAPCTDTPEFYGRFARGVETGKLNETFEYLFSGRRRMSVWIHMFKSGPGEFWILVKRIED
jgi:methyl-accepting chemotaxis protein